MIPTAPELSTELRHGRLQLLTQLSDDLVVSPEAQEYAPARVRDVSDERMHRAIP